jgi:phosphoesterase RecJ-like protein
MTVQQTGGKKEVEDLAEYALKIKGVLASALFRLSDSKIRVSLRGRDNIDVSKIARRFGGGGHPKASGFTIEGDREAIYTGVVEALIQEVEDKSPGSD